MAFIICAKFEIKVVCAGNGGIPQGTKLAPLLFAILVNNLCRDWRYRIKYVDDTSVFESIPRCFGRGKKMENIV